MPSLASFEVGHGEVGGAPLVSSRVLPGIARIQAIEQRTITGRARLVLPPMIVACPSITPLVGGFQIGFAEVGGGAPCQSQQSISGIARISGGTPRTITGIAKIQAQNSQALNGRARITAGKTQVISGVARITIWTSRIISGTGRITGTGTQVISGIGRISGKSTRTIAGVANILLQNQKVLTGVANILAGRIITGRANIIQPKTITGLAKIQVTGSKSISGIAHILVTGYGSQTITGRARITGIGSRGITGVARIVVTVTNSQTIGGRARISIVSPQTIGGLARIQLASQRNISGIAHLVVTGTTTQGISGRARITGISQQTISGKASLVVKTVKTINGVGRITPATNQMISGRANILAVPRPCLVPINYEPTKPYDPALPWTSVGVQNFSYGGPFTYGGNLYSISWGNAAPVSAQIWKSTDGGNTWIGLAQEQTYSWSDFNYYWDPLYPSPIITFAVGDGVNSVILFDFNLSTESWSAGYASHLGPWDVTDPNSFSIGNIVRLSDGRVINFYFRPAPNLAGDFCWAVANTGGSKVWDSIHNLIWPNSSMPPPPPPQSPVKNVWGVCRDANDRAHCIFSYATGYTSGHFVSQISYVSLSSSYVLNPVQVLLANWYDYTALSNNLIAAPDGNLYTASTTSKYNQTRPPYSDVQVWIGNSWANPTWTQVQIAQYNTSGTGTWYPAFYPTVGWVAGQLTVMWTVAAQPISQFTEYAVYFAYMTSGGLWSAPQFYVDLNCNGPSSSLFSYSGPNVAWNISGIGFGDVPSALHGIGLILGIPVNYNLANLGGPVAFFVQCSTFSGCLAPTNPDWEADGTTYDANVFSGPYAYRGNLYVVSDAAAPATPSGGVMGNHPYPPRIDVSRDNGATWIPLAFPPASLDPAQTTPYYYRWSFAFDPKLSTNTITFLVDIVGSGLVGLMDFNLDTESWGTVYGKISSLNPNSGNSWITRLTDGRVRFLNIISPSGQNYSYVVYSCYDPASSSWTIINYTIIGITPGRFYGFYGLTNPSTSGSLNGHGMPGMTDTSNRTHVFVVYHDPSGQPHHEHVSIDASGTLSTVTEFWLPPLYGSGPNFTHYYFGFPFAASDGKIYIPMEIGDSYYGAPSTSNNDTMSVIIGSSWANPTWSVQKAWTSNSLSDPGWWIQNIRGGDINGLVTLVVNTVLQDSSKVFHSPFPINEQVTESFQAMQLVGGIWTTPVTLLDILQNPPPCPFTDGSTARENYIPPAPAGTIQYVCYGMSIGYVSSVPSGIGLIANLYSYFPDGTQGYVVYYNSCGAVVRPRRKKNYIAINDILMSSTLRYIV